METIVLAFTKHVEVKGVDFTSEVFVVQKHSGDVAQVLCIHFLLLSIKFKHAHFIVSVDLVARRAPYHAPNRMSLELNFLNKEVKTKRANVEYLAVILPW